jgi:phage tail-like protein
MGIYNTFGYSDGTLYGSSSKIEYSVTPFTCVAIDYVKDGGDIIRPDVVLNWTNPAGAILGFRIVRNQDGFSETEEDGHIIFEVFNGVPTVQSITDKNFVIPLIPGLYAYYTIWLLRPDQTWFPAGNTFCLIPKEHSTNTPEGSILISAQDKFVGLLPRAYTTLQQSYVDEIDPSSDIYSFLGGFSFTLDELLTYIDSVTPDISGRATNPNFVGVQANQLGLPAEPTLGLRTQKRLIRQAVNVYKTRGTLLGLRTFIESLTSFAPVITISPNVMIDAQNSSFYETIGNWKSDENCAVTSATDITTYQLENFSVDRTYSGKVVTTDVDAVISNGISNPKLEGTPVNHGVEYELSWYQTSPSDTGNVTPVITWFDYAGNILGTEVTGAPSAVSSGWNKQTLTATSPGLSVNATAVSVTSNVATVVVDEDHPFSVGQTAYFYDLGYPFNGAQVITATTSTSVSFAVPGDDIPLTYEAGMAHEPFAVFAGIQFLFDSVGTFYLDMIQLAETSDVRSTDFYEARGLEIFLTPSKVNYIQNPSFADVTGDGDYDWSITGATSTDFITPTTVPGVFDGSHMLQVETSAVDPLLIKTHTYAVMPNAYYTFSVYAQTVSGTENLDITIEALDNNNDPIFGSNGLEVINSASIEVDSTWSRYSVTIFVPNTFGEPHFEISLSGNTTGNTINLDAAQLEHGYTKTDYFDGSYSSRGALWLGTTDESMSVLYRNKSNKIGRLVAELPDNLPMNTPWVITTGSSTVKLLETSGFSS